MTRRSHARFVPGARARAFSAARAGRSCVAPRGKAANRRRADPLGARLVLAARLRRAPPLLPPPSRPSRPTRPDTPAPNTIRI